MGSGLCARSNSPLLFLEQIVNEANMNEHRRHWKTQETPMAHRIAPFLFIPLLVLSGCPDDSAEAPENAETSTTAETKKEAPKPDTVKEA